MVCARCIKVFTNELAELDIKPESVKLGDVFNIKYFYIFIRNK